MLRHIAPLVLAQLASSSLLHQPALKQMIRPWCLNSHFVLRLEMVQTQCRKKIAEYIRFSWFSYVRIHQNCRKWLHVRSPVWICPYTRHGKEVADLQPVNSAASPSGGFTVRLRSYLHLLVPKLKRNELQVCKFLRNTSRFAKTLCHLAIRYGG